ncbi:GvpL/GvpF family gas vesicle protein [Streptomyces sp. NPDC053048]|uniref:GvpL/GvpF family gas vesicle protein n=1 Tax=Streptomyces sp. NPDC053048 TaxID=3365694 RepID=UPI0037CF2B04
MHEKEPRYLYAYAVTRESDTVDRALRNVTGVAGEPVSVVRHLGLMALTGPVPAADHEERALAARLEDLEWLETTARAHQRVVAAAAEAAPCVLPLRLATVFRDERGVRAMLDDRLDSLRAALDRLDGRTEWGVKVYAHEPAPAPTGTPRAAAVSGRDYLRRRAAERHTAQQETRRVDATARGIHTALAVLAQETRLHPPQNPRLSRHPDRNVLNAAYLVRREDAPSFTSAVAGLAELAPGDGMRVELTGPWAPYSFAGQDDTAQDAGPEPS